MENKNILKTKTSSRQVKRPGVLAWCSFLAHDFDLFFFVLLLELQQILVIIKIMCLDY